jgi:hypothetical protein
MPPKKQDKKRKFDTKEQKTASRHAGLDKLGIKLLRTENTPSVTEAKADVPQDDVMLLICSAHT